MAVREQLPSTHYHNARTAWQNNVSAGMPPRELPPEDAEVRAALDESLQLFLETCFPDVFVLDWSEDHLGIIRDIQHRIEHGGLKAIAMPRGSGKTSILLRAAIFAILTGRRRFVCIVAANESSAVDSLFAIKSELNHNPYLLKYYARETWTIRHLGNEPRRATGQHYDGKSTGVEYGQHKLCFGTIPDCCTSGAVISTAGITGQIRGQQHTTIESTAIRPDLALVDDPQTKVSAGSLRQVQRRHETMMGDVLGLAGPGVNIAGFCACTVIYQDDVADRILDRQRSKEWNGDKVSMIKSWPKWMEGWDQFDAIRGDELAAGGDDDSRSQAFVRDNFEKLHEGADVYWSDRYSERDQSALHHAMQLYYRDQGVFASEYQNKPLSAAERAPFELNAVHLAQRTVGLPRAQVPVETQAITGFIDVQMHLLYYTLCAWTTDGRCYVIDYGACPDQQRHYWSKSEITHPLEAVYGEDMETYLRQGLDWLIKAILENDYRTEHGAQMQVDRLAIDARWGECTEIVRRFVRDHQHRPRLTPSMGMYIGANTRSWQKLKQNPKEKEGTHAKLQPPKTGYGQLELLYDTNYWKSFCADRLSVSKESSKAILLFDAAPHVHRMFAEHCCYEEPVKVIGKSGNEVVEWRQRKLGSTTENDYWDCLVGNCALASTIGVKTHQGMKVATPINLALDRVLKRRGLT